MSLEVGTKNKTYLSSLSESEKKDIEETVKFKIGLTNYTILKKMVLVGASTNALTGLFVIWVLFQQVKHSTLFIWYFFLVAFNLLNIAWSAYFWIRYPQMTPAILKRWLSKIYFIFAAMCLTWGCMGILFVSQNLFYTLFVITFLQIAALGFGFGTLFDFLLALVCITGLLLPTIGYQLYETTQHVATLGHDNFLNLAFSISLIILGVFLLIVCYIGYKLTVSQTTLSFFNEALNEKLENLNQFLEHRVKERTAELEKSLKLVTYQSTHDLLTDLPNQRLLLEYMQKSIESSHNNNHQFAVLSFTINELEKINDGLGHQAGDLVIKTIAQRFQNRLSEKKQSHRARYFVTLSRKDIFVIILDPISQMDHIDNKVEFLFSILDDPIATESQSVKLTGSVGISIYPNHGGDIQTLIMNADAAMLWAKQRGGNSIHIYQPAINADYSRQLELESGLHQAVKKEEFILQYQPFVDLSNGKICGMEALVRWQHPTLGYISPMHFIALAEKNGIIVPLGEWVLRTACHQLKYWQELGFEHLKIAVNLSSKQLLQKNIIQTIENILKESRISPESLELELTETEAFKDDVIPILKQFKAMNLGLSIDDFGTGYSGLSNLKLITIDKLKIDKSFVQDIVTNEHSRVIASNIINLAKKLKVTVLAEGVETKEQLDFLKEHDCNLIQGYYFSPPIYADEFTQLLETNVQYTV